MKTCFCGKKAIDAATKEQAELQPVPNKPEEEGNKDNPEDDILMDDTDDLKVCYNEIK